MVTIHNYVSRHYNSSLYPLFNLKALLAPTEKETVSNLQNSEFLGHFPHALGKKIENTLRWMSIDLVCTTAED